MSNETLPMHYEMNPKSESLLFDGTYLVENMIVLIGDSMFRANPSSTMVSEIHKAKVRNRWCRVTNLKTRNNGGNREVAFIGVYEDGAQYKRVHSIETPWLVKNDVNLTDEIDESNDELASLHGHISRLYARLRHLNRENIRLRGELENNNLDRNGTEDELHEAHLKMAELMNWTTNPDVVE